MKSNKHAEAHPELHPPSLQSSGAGLDPECYPAGSGGIPQAEAGEGLDSAIKKIDGKKR
jgi:hypothetical protein